MSWPSAPRNASVTRAVTTAVIGTILVACAPSSPSPSTSPSAAASTSAAPTVTSFADVLAAAEVGYAPSSLALTDSALWVAHDQGVSRVDLATERAGPLIPIGPMALVAAGGAGVWAISYVENALGHLDPATGEIELRVAVESPTAVAVGPDAVWVLRSRTGVLERRDPVRGELVATIEVPFVEDIIPLYPSQGPWTPAMEVDATGVWVGAPRGLVHVDPATNSVRATIPEAAAARAIAFGGGAVWAASEIAAAIYRVDPAADRVTATFTAAAPSMLGSFGLAFDGTDLWASGPELLQRIDVRSGHVIEAIELGWAPGRLAVGSGVVWIGSQARPHATDDQWRLDNRVLKLATRGVASATTEPDAALADGPAPFSIEHDVVFMACITGQDCTKLLDVYVPTGASGTAPVVVTVRGSDGSNCNGCRSWLHTLAEALAQRGALVYNIDWAQPGNLDCAIRYARATAAAHGGDPDTVVLVGHSLGATASGQVVGGASAPSTCVPGATGSPLPTALVWLDGTAAIVPTMFDGNPGVVARLFARGTELFGVVPSLRDKGIDIEATKVTASHLDFVSDLGSPMPTLQTILELAGLSD